MTSGFNDHSIFQIYNLSNYFMTYRQYNPVCYLSYLYYLHCMQYIHHDIVQLLNCSNPCDSVIFVFQSSRLSCIFLNHTILSVLLVWIILIPCKVYYDRPICVSRLYYLTRILGKKYKKEVKFQKSTFPIDTSFENNVFMTTPLIVDK